MVLLVPTLLFKMLNFIYSENFTKFQTIQNIKGSLMMLDNNKLLGISGLDFTIFHSGILLNPLFSQTLYIIQG